MFTYLIWSCVPPEVAFEIAQAASFLMSNSAVCRSCTRGAIMFAWITACNTTMVFRTQIDRAVGRKMTSY